MAHAFILVCLGLINLVCAKTKLSLVLDQEFGATDTYIPGEYIVTLHKNASVVHNIRELVEVHGSFDLTTKSRNVIGHRQFLLISGNTIDVNALRANPFIADVAPNMILRAYGTYSDLKSTVVDELVTEATSREPQLSCTSQNVLNLWGLDRLDQRDKVSGEAQYIFGSTDGDGAGVNAYIVDSGVNYTDPEFGNRALWGHTATGLMDGDGNGHGTHVAGTVGADTYGVAKKVNIIVVKVLNFRGSGTVSGLIGGLEWVMQDFVRKGKPNSVVNLSLGFGGISTPTDTAVQEIIDAGITVVAAAGNSAEDACTISPAHIKDTITVGASDVNDNAAGFSNWGTCLDIWAPGDKILSVGLSDPDIKSGTSMAAPHVTGVIARYLSTMTSQKPTPAEVAHWLDGMTTKNKLTLTNNDVKMSPNKLLFVDCAETWTTQKPTNIASNRRISFALILLCVGIFQITLYY